MALDYPTLRAILADERLPAALVDLDAFDRNLERVLDLVRPRALPVRIATKSVRAVSLLRRLLDRGGGLTRGLMCFTCEEAAFLAARGFDDLLIAYPAWQRRDLELVAKLVHDGRTVRLVADSLEGIRRISEVGAAHGVRVPIVLCLDLSLRLAGDRVHVGVRRSPLREPAEVVSLAREAESLPGTTFHGLLGYEAQVAGLPDRGPVQRALNPVKSLVRRLSVPLAADLRGATVRALTAAGLPPRVVNGGGTGSLDTTSRDQGVTEVTAGSAFFKPALFDGFSNAHVRALEPAAFFALEVTRVPGKGFVTCAGGGYVASGPAGRDKVPLPWLPEGISLLDAEQCGEVQTPLVLARDTRLRPGDPVIFRHAKAGELAERFDSFLLVASGEVAGRAATYRGEGQCYI